MASPTWRAFQVHATASSSSGRGALKKFKELKVVTVNRPPRGCFPVAEGAAVAKVVISRENTTQRGVASLRLSQTTGVVGMRASVYNHGGGFVVVNYDRLHKATYLDWLVAVYEGIARSTEDWRRTYRIVCLLCGLTVGVGLAHVVGLDYEAYLKGLEAIEREEHASSVLDSAARSAAWALSSVDLAPRFVRKNSRSKVDEAYALMGSSPLGEGSFGVVYRGVHNRTGIERAVKCIDKESSSNVDLLRQEIEAQARMDHPHVSRLVEFFETGRHLYLVSELCSGGELCDRVEAARGGLAEREVALLMSQMIRATLHCHSRSFIHRDLKPENFLFAEPVEGAAGGPAPPLRGHLKLIDFGWATPVGSFVAEVGIGEQRCASSGGTLLYCSPQALLGKPASEGDDMWSLGVVLHVLLTGRFPFSTNDDDRFQEMFDAGLLRRDVEVQLNMLEASPEAVDLLRGLLAYDSQERITAAEALRHPFLSRAGVGSFGDPAGSFSTEDIRSRLDRFATSCRLRRIIATALARLSDGRQQSSVEPAALRTFQQLDRKGDGFIRVGDLAFFLRGQRLGRDRADGRAGSDAAEATAQGMTYSTFLAAVLDGPGGGALVANEQLLRSVFEFLDSDRDQAISPGDLSRRLGVSEAAGKGLLMDALAEISRRSAAGAAEHASENAACKCSRILYYEDFVALMKGGGRPTIQC